MPKRILVADDEPHMRRVMEYHLKRAGYELSFALNGRETVEKAASEHPDLVVLDVMMPEVDGVSALKALKQKAATRGIPVVMITASAQALTRQESEAAGAAAFFTKPFSPTQVLAEIKRLLERNAP